MRTRSCDMAIIGGGLSGGLIALAVARAYPDIDIALVEGGVTLGGNHRWSWFDSDLDDAGRALLAGFPQEAWGGGYDVRFPAYQRTLRGTYRSLASRDFDAHLRSRLNQGSVLTGRRAAELRAGGVSLAGGEEIAARCVIDCRGIDDAPDLNGGWQVFLGQHWRMARPHGIERPVIMDAAVEQHGAYRFVYLLPLGADELFIEDTYYADLPRFDRAELSERIAAYAAMRGWSGEVLHEETGALPVIAGGDFAAFQAARARPGVAMAGTRGGFVHPLTSYTLPSAALIAGLVAAKAHLPGEELAKLLAGEARAHWRRTGFYRLLADMLFGAAVPEERYRIFQRFYRLGEPLIERFYAGRCTLVDKARILSGRPPVPVARAVRSLVTSRPSLTAPSPDRKTFPQ